MTPKTVSGPRLRNKGIRRVRVADIDDAPFNFRSHPEAQQAALGGTIDEIGFYGYPDVWEPAPGRLQKRCYVCGECGKEWVADVRSEVVDDIEIKTTRIVEVRPGSA